MLSDLAGYHDSPIVEISKKTYQKFLYVHSKEIRKLIIHINVRGSPAFSVVVCCNDDVVDIDVSIVVYVTARIIARV